MIYELTKWDKRYLELAEFVSKWSKDPSTKVGAVVVSPKNTVVSLGFNGLPIGVADTHERLFNRELKYKMIVHGEINAITFSGQSLANCVLYTWPFMPCSRCAGSVIQSGIKKVIAPYSNNERWIEDFELTRLMFSEAGVDMIEVKS
jgi:dCMP deaminase